MVRIRNITSQGAMIEGLSNVAVRSALAIEIFQNGSIIAEVRWSQDGRAGLRFAVTLDLVGPQNDSVDPAKIRGSCPVSHNICEETSIYSQSAGILSEPGRRYYEPTFVSETNSIWAMFNIGYWFVLRRAGTAACA
jgi:hypothetical protein